MDTSFQQAQRTVQYASRTDIRDAVHHIVRRILLDRLAQQRHDGHTTARRLCKSDRCRAQRQAHVLEDILYRRASSLEDYQDLSSLEERVLKAGRALYINVHRREMERESRRRIANGGGGVGGEAGEVRRRVPSQVVGRQNGRIQRSGSF
mmetsp:Transcript_29528/g.62652  ORF Transcript_29528/g.62652 Transcript_29528/m.62652 type:complete len:150 (-) Transcript_29528:192-641(-)|eukprot:CAMPEP_0172310660 /NCGR_PEP_ID=MMETSP1058-20130122/12327_1 /TAXON_ID=83371 /ORGANISM="Detonula confervacea, Strain CCMP 353" /LENGTH=149 /DNA_ID=CAMNT_0013023557 /DNA_START=85 /DNA_END=534 /DNA_ORIENTATION=+